MMTKYFASWNNLTLIGILIIKGEIHVYICWITCRGCHFFVKHCQRKILIPQQAYLHLLQVDTFDRKWLCPKYQRSDHCLKNILDVVHQTIFFFRNFSSEHTNLLGRTLPLKWNNYLCRRIKVQIFWELPYARHYNPWFVHFFTPFFTTYIVERLVLQIIYELNIKILQFLGLKSAVYNQERVIMVRER